MTEPILSQLTGAFERTLHSAGRESCSVPVVVVPSTNVPSALAVQVPVTCRVPVTCPVGHDKANRACMSNSPDRLRQAEATVQVPVTTPPHGVTLAVGVHDTPPPAPPLLELPPVCPPLLELPPLPVPPFPVTPPLPEEPPVFAVVLPPVDDVLEPEPQAPTIDTHATAVARKADWSFILRLLTFGGT
jgi:hypothetical protein